MTNLSKDMWWGSNALYTTNANVIYLGHYSEPQEWIIKSTQKTKQKSKKDQISVHYISEPIFQRN